MSKRETSRLGNMILREIKYAFIFVLFALYACNNDSNSRTNNLEMISDSSEDNGIKLWENGKIRDTAAYISVGHPDTAIVLFFHQNLNTVNYNSIIEYCRLCEEEDKIFRIYRQMFSEEKDVEEQIVEIKKLKELIVDSARTCLISDFKTYGYDSDSPEADCLLFKCHDFKIIQYLKELLKSGKLSRKEKREIENDFLRSKIDN
jgi:hypothetical protein